MTIYLGYLFLIGLQSILISCNKNEAIRLFSLSISKKKLIILLSCLELIVLAGLRSVKIGADTQVYINALDYYRDLDLKSILFAELVWPFDFEIGYFLFTKICAFLQMNNTIFLFVIAFFIYIPLFKFIYERSKMPILSIYIYFGLGIFSYSLGIFRQMIACSILLLSIQYIESRKLFKFLIIVFSASLFHMTAIIMLPMYWLVNFNLKHYIKWMFALEFILLVFSRPILEFVFSIIPAYSNYIGSFYDVSGGTYIMLLFFTVLAILTVKMDLKQNQVSIYCLYIALMLQALAYSMNLFGRIIPYFSIHLIILIPEIINFYVKQKRKIVILFVCAFFLLMTFKDLYNNQYVCPYHFFWDSIEEGGKG